MIKSTMSFIWFNSELCRYEFGFHKDYINACRCSPSLTSIILLERFDVNCPIDLIKNKVEKLNLKFV